MTNVEAIVISAGTLFNSLAIIRMSRATKEAMKQLRKVIADREGW